MPGAAARIHRLTRAAAVLLAACGGEDPPAPGEAPCGGAAAVAEAGEAILRGEIDTGDPAVVAINTLDVDCQRAGAPACTGALIGPDLVLTAAHCIGELPPESFVVLIGPTADPGRGELGAGLDGQLFRVLATRMHPDLDPQTLANDLALLRIDGEPPAPPAALPASPLDVVALPGAPARVVGFGQADAAPPFSKREGTITITEYSPLEFVYHPSPAMTCAGDSGGPVLMDQGGAEVIVGITSRGDPACVDHGVAIRTDALPPSFLEAPW